MSEFYGREVQRLFSFLKSGEHYSRFGKVVEITHGENIKFEGFLAGKSIVIPLSCGKDSDEQLFQVVGANIEAASQNSSESIQEATCHLLGLPYNGLTLRLYSDGQNFGQISAIHLHPEGFIASQEDFIKWATESLSKVDSTLTILE